MEKFKNPSRPPLFQYLEGLLTRQTRFWCPTDPHFLIRRGLFSRRCWNNRSDRLEERHAGGGRRQAWQVMRRLVLSRGRGRRGRSLGALRGCANILSATSSTRILSQHRYHLPLNALPTGFTDAAEVPSPVSITDFVFIASHNQIHVATKTKTQKNRHSKEAQMKRRPMKESLRTLFGAAAAAAFNTVHLPLNAL